MPKMQLKFGKISFEYISIDKKHDALPEIH